MILEIDAGNSRIKWRVVTENESASQTIALGNILTTGALASNSSGLEKMTSDLDNQMRNIERVRVSSVRGGDFKTVLTEVFKQKWQILPEFASVEKVCGGVTNSYADPGSMGVDRWMAIIAAYKKCAAACCVLDCGSAITFDWVDAQGLHQGGYIVPGFQLMKESLARKTPALAENFDDWGSIEPGTSTRAAISNGLAAMVTGFAQQCFERVAQKGDQAQWLLTGGDAQVLSKNLSWPHQVEKNLVLDGLAIALP